MALASQALQIAAVGLHPKPDDLEGAEPVYKQHGFVGSLHPPPEGVSPNFRTDGSRKVILREWGKMRERHMHREPQWCMDQLVSGSGLYPPRHLTDDWFTKEELGRIQTLETQLASTNHAQVLARDMMALRIYEVDISIILDDSGSMSLSMFGRNEWVGQGWDRRHIEQVFGNRAFTPDSLGMFMNTGCRLAAGDSRWNFMVDALMYWEPLFATMKLQPHYYTMNRGQVFTSLAQAMARGPIGATPSGATFLRVLGDIERKDPEKTEPHLVLCLTDGEANDKARFNAVLDSIQDGAYGDVQVLLMGLSLEPEDIRFFEDEECDDTRIRTIEAYEVEQQMILWRRVIDRSTDYNFAMHSVCALVTNFFPGDYDYEAPIQTLRHRLYITLHALDRRVTGLRDNTYTDSGGFDCLAGCFAGFSKRPARQGGTVDSAEAELSQVLCDPRFETLLSSLRPPPKKASQYGAYGGYGGYGGYGTSLARDLDLDFQGYGGYGGYGNSNTRSVLPYLQSAIGALQPSEMVNRDLQFANISRNSRAVRRAVQLMCQARDSANLR